MPDVPRRGDLQRALGGDIEAAERVRTREPHISTAASLRELVGESLWDPRDSTAQRRRLLAFVGAQPRPKQERDAVAVRLRALPLEPGGPVELHWYDRTDELLYPERCPAVPRCLRLDGERYPWDPPDLPERALAALNVDPEAWDALHNL